MKQRLKSFSYAFNGLKVLIQEEANARIHLISAVLAISLGLVLRISTSEWLAIIIVIGLVFVAEILNSAIENLADFVSPERHELIKKVKDLAAASALVAALTAFVVGLLVFMPKLGLYLK